MKESGPDSDVSEEQEFLGKIASNQSDPVHNNLVGPFSNNVRQLLKTHNFLKHGCMIANGR
jgi:hypothetical protein